MLNQFEKNPNLLSHYYIKCTFLFIFLNLTLWKLDFWSFEPGIIYWLAFLAPLIISNFVSVCITLIVCTFFTIEYFGTPGTTEILLLLGGIYFGMLHTALIHNCAHNNFKPKMINRPLGELLALHMMSGYPGFAIIHLQHHKYADDPDLDPHPNKDLTYWQYLNSIKKMLRRSFIKMYTKNWGNDEKALKTWSYVRYLLPINRVLRALTILLVFGPIGFVYFYIPSYISSQLTYAHVNFYTHAKQKDGSIEIINMNHNIIYKILNIILLGIYFHKNHHEKPGYFNPMFVKKRAP